MVKVRTRKGEAAFSWAHTKTKGPYYRRMHVDEVEVGGPGGKLGTSAAAAGAVSLTVRLGLHSASADQGRRCHHNILLTIQIYRFLNMIDFRDGMPSTEKPYPMEAHVRPCAPMMLTWRGVLLLRLEE